MCRQNTAGSFHHTACILILHSCMLMSWVPLVGNEAMLSKKTLKSRYEAESPDELALVKAVCNYGCRLLSRTNDYVSIFIPTQDKVTFKV